MAPQRVDFDAYPGTLLRNCDVVGTCLAVSDAEHYRRALEMGDTVAQHPHIRW